VRGVPQRVSTINEPFTAQISIQPELGHRRPYLGALVGTRLESLMVSWLWADQGKDHLVDDLDQHPIGDRWGVHKEVLA
jgi:hypothetical protein